MRRVWNYPAVSLASKCIVCVWQKSWDDAESKCKEFETGAEEVQRLLTDALKGTRCSVG